MKNIHFNPSISLPVQRSRVESLTRLALAGLIVLFSFAAGAQTTYYVDADASSGNDGSSWANAYTDLQDALGASTSGDSIFVAAGTYTPSTSGLTDPRLATFIIPAGVLVYGGFAGDEANLAARDLSLGNETILSGDLGTAITTLGDFTDAGYADNTYHVVSMPNANATLDGFTVEAGNADDGDSGNNPEDDGGGVYVTATGMLRNLTVRYNTANTTGGGMFLRNESSGPLTAVNCTVYDNEANFGGGMYLENESSGPLTAVNCTAYGNNANTSGGGMYLNNSSTGTLTVANSISFGNTAASEGSDIYHFTNGTAATLANCLLGEAATGDPLTITNPVGTDDGNGNVLANPLFANTTVRDANFLRLLKNSPAIDAGDNSFVPTDVTTDLAGNDRIQNTTVDVGAYERTFFAASASIYYVDTNVIGGAGDGSSWANAYTDLQDALGASTSGDSIFVADGIYMPSTAGLTDDREAAFRIPECVLVYGGFAGDEANLAARDLSLGNETILSGDLGTAITTLGDFTDAGYADNSYHVVSMPNADALLDGFTVQGGNAGGSFPNNAGGGIYATAAGILRNLTVRYNTATFGGGMILWNQSTGLLTAVNCTAYGNNANNAGGGMYLWNRSTGTLTVTNGAFYDNEANWGGGMYLDNVSTGLLTAVNCTAYGNNANSSGGGMYFRNLGTGLLTAVNCTAYGNNANNSGGGMYLRNLGTGPLTAVNCTAYSNNANSWGGGMYLYNESTGPLTAVNCTAYGNNANTSGGGGMLLDNRSTGPAHRCQLHGLRQQCKYFWRGDVA